jgi:hypothetical protein
MIQEVSHGPHRTEERKPGWITAIGAGLISEGSTSSESRGST